MQLRLLDGACSSPATSADSWLRLTHARGAEYLVLADLSFAGLTCYPVAEGIPYDAVVELPSGLSRIQVKSANIGRDHQGNRRGYLFEHGGLSKYEESADFFAFVALDRKLVLYVKTRRVRRIFVNADKFTPETCRMSLDELKNG